MTIRLHELYPIPDGAVVDLRSAEIAALRADAGAAPDEDLVFDVCFVCSEASLVSRTAGTGLTSGRYASAIGPLCQALLTQIGAPPDPTLLFVRNAILGYRYIATSVKTEP